MLEYKTNKDIMSPHTQIVSFVCIDNGCNYIDKKEYKDFVVMIENRYGKEALQKMVNIVYHYPSLDKEISELENIMTIEEQYQAWDYVKDIGTYFFNHGMNCDEEQGICSVCNKRWRELKKEGRIDEDK